jgi:DNA mismatch repair protein MutS2
VRRHLEESRRRLENLVRELREGEISREKTVKVKEFIRELENDSAAIDAALETEEAALAEVREASDAEKSSAGEKAAAISAGDEVFVVSANGKKQRGVVVRAENRGGEKKYLVETGSVKIAFPESALEKAPASRAAAAAHAAADYAVPAPAFELSLLGMRLPDALEALRRQIDAAVLSGLNNFAVIHGKGDGILQKGVHDYLSTESAVADYYFSRPELGGFGRTEVVLKG